MQQHQASSLDIQISAGSAYSQVKQLYERNSTQARSFTYYSFISSAIGIVLIVVGVMFVFLQNSTAGIITGIIITLAGVMPQLLAALFLKAARDLNLMQDGMVEKLVDIEKYGKAIDIVLALQSDEVRDDLIKKIIDDLLASEAGRKTKDVSHSKHVPAQVIARPD